MVVDDDAFCRKLMGMYLKQIGVEVELLANGWQCLLSIAKAYPDLIFMDCQMPELDGFETTRQLRKLNYNGPIYALTGDSDAETIQQCITSGMNGHLSKPVDRTMIGAKIAELFPHFKSQTSESGQNLEDLLERARKIAEASGNSALLSRLIRSFVTTAEQSMNSLQAAWQKQDKASATAAAHKLRGSAASFGAQSFSLVAGEIEDALATKDLKECEALLQKLQSLWTPLHQFLMERSMP